MSYLGIFLVLQFLKSIFILKISTLEFVEMQQSFVQK